jgi:ATP-dependent RNA/DNA helicase IGHMBP2
MDYFKRLSDLLKIERQEDKENYERLTQATSVTERRANGLTWYPVAIRGSELGKGDYLTVTLERTTHTEISHQLRFGVPAALFSQHDAKNNRIEGIISYQGANQLKLTVHTDELPEWSRDGKLGVDLLFDDNSYDEMNQALKTAANAVEHKKFGRLIRILTGIEVPTFDANVEPFTSNTLNTVQLQAVNKILQAEDLAIVHGPPGTGKTTTLVQAITEIWHRTKQKILVTAPSNTAVDLLSEKLAAAGLNVLRVGNPVRVSESLMSLTLDARSAAHPSIKEVKKLRKQANEFRDMAHKYKRNFGRAEREQRKALFDAAYKIIKDIANIEQYVTEDIIEKANVITATLVGANHYTVKRQEYHTVVIDEAGQSLEPAAWIPILKGQKVILAGDHFQLPPTVKSNEALRNGLAETLLEKNVTLHPEAVTLLQVQYRMNTEIMGFPSREFYEGKLVADASVATRRLFADDQPVEFLDTAGCGFEEKLDGTSTTNPEEASLLVKHLIHLTEKLLQQKKPADFPSIAIISPYRQQIVTLQEMIDGASALKAVRHRLFINTIDSFQGQERDAVYISLTRSNSNGEIGFLADTRRMNVAMTRARKKLVVIGDSATLSQNPFYLDFINYTESINAYKSAWELIAE